MRQAVEGVPPQSSQSDSAILLLLTSLLPWLSSTSASAQFCEDGGVGMLVQVCRSHPPASSGTSSATGGGGRREEGMLHRPREAWEIPRPLLQAPHPTD
jgi:hypothetical protein